MVTAFNTSPLVKTYTLEEFWALPVSPDCSKLELIAGVLYMKPRREPKQDAVVSRLVTLLVEHKGNAGHESARVDKDMIIRDFFMSTEMKADVLFHFVTGYQFYTPSWVYKHANPEDYSRRLDGIAVEVFTIYSATYARHTKKDTYAALGVRELWLVDDQAETIEVLKLAGKRYDEGRTFAGDDVILSAVLPRVTFTAAQVFAD